jgi:hypothetical protein
MKNKVLFSVITLLAGSLIAAESTPKDDVLAAAKALGNSASYSWKSTVANAGGGGGGGGRGGGPSEGKTQKDSYTLVTSTFGGNTSEMVLKGDKGAMSTPDNGWQTLAELEADQGGPGQFMSARMRNFKAPAAQVADLAANTAEIKKDADTYSGDLTETGAKAMLSFGGRGGGAGPTISDAKGSAKFWIKDGVLSKYETHVTGKVNFNGNDRDVDRTTTVEIKDVGTTKVEVPADALKKLNPAPAAAAKP